MRDVHAFASQPIDELYRWFAGEAAPTSPAWERVCLWVAEHPEVNTRLDALPDKKRQPNLFLAAIKYLGGPRDAGPELGDWVAAHWPDLERVIMSRATQTNEVGRLAVLAPVLASLPQPITLLEVGSSAGVCLFPDRYRYDMRQVVDGEHVWQQDARVAASALLAPAGLHRTRPSCRAGWRAGRRARSTTSGSARAAGSTSTPSIRRIPATSPG